jgi:hypothetical protein
LSSPPLVEHFGQRAGQIAAERAGAVGVDFDVQGIDVRQFQAGDQFGENSNRTTTVPVGYPADQTIRRDPHGLAFNALDDDSCVDRLEKPRV